MAEINPNRSNLDQTQILQRSFDESKDRLRVDANINIDSATIIVETDYNTDSMAIGDPSTSTLLHVNTDGSINADVVLNANSDSIRLGDGTNLNTMTTVGSKKGIDANIIGGSVTGTLNPTGLSNGLKTQRMIITDVPQQVPTTPLTGRNTMSVRILGTNIVYLGNSTVTSAAGYPKYNKEEIVMDIQANPSVNLWAVCDTGLTCEIAIMEIS